MKTPSDEQWWRRRPIDSLREPDVERGHAIYDTSLTRVTLRSYRFTNPTFSHTLSMKRTLSLFDLANCLWLAPR